MKEIEILKAGPIGSEGVESVTITIDREFPDMADILLAVDEYRQRPRRPDPTGILIADETSRHDLTPEEVERNKERVQLIVEALAGRMSFDDAEREVAGMVHIGEFATMGELSGKRGFE